MQIILIQAEIEVAIRNYVNSKVKIAADQDIRIDLSASRGPEGFRANIDIVDALVPVDVYIPRAATTAAPKTAAVGVDEAAAPSTEKVAVDEPSAQEQEQVSTNVEESAEVSTTESVPTVRKPLFGKSLAPLNA